MIEHYRGPHHIHPDLEHQVLELDNGAIATVTYFLDEEVVKWAGYAEASVGTKVDLANGEKSLYDLPFDQDIMFQHPLHFSPSAPEDEADGFGGPAVLENQGELDTWLEVAGQLSPTTDRTENSIRSDKVRSLDDSKKLIAMYPAEDNMDGLLEMMEMLKAMGANKDRH